MAKRGAVCLNNWQSRCLEVSSRLDAVTRQGTLDVWTRHSPTGGLAGGDIGARGNRMVGSGRRSPTGESNRMDAFYERLVVRAATLDEVLSDDFEPLPGQKGDADLAARRLAAWCRACASGDWSLFDRRLARDGLAFASVLARLAAVRRSASAAPPSWLDDAVWIEAALHDADGNTAALAPSHHTAP